MTTGRRPDDERGAPPPRPSVRPSTRPSDRRPERRSKARLVGRVLLAALVALVLAGAVLVLLAYYTGLEFDVEVVGAAVVVAGIVVFLWTRWR